MFEIVYDRQPDAGPLVSYKLTEEPLAQVSLKIMPVSMLTNDELEQAIMITCPCNEHPHTPHFYTVKLGFTWEYIIFLFYSKT